MLIGVTLGMSPKAMRDSGLRPRRTPAPQPRRGLPNEVTPSATYRLHCQLLICRLNIRSAHLGTGRSSSVWGQGAGLPLPNPQCRRGFSRHEGLSLLAFHWSASAEEWRSSLRLGRPLKAHALLEQLSRVHLVELRRRAPELAKMLKGLSG